MSKLYDPSATELAALIRTGNISSREVVDAHLERIEQLNEAGVQRPTPLTR
jgi:Asp-tRNA(Asn)/Glu-tRNA(Gln) amidotransferase A subunit family amidase